MSLTISFIFLSEKSHESVFKMDDLFGFEICRKELWGNQKLKDLECTIIPKLETQDIFIIKDDLYKLYNDCEIILKNSFEISLITNYSKEFIELRINNLLSFLEIALENKNNLGINIS